MALLDSLKTRIDSTGVLDITDEELDSLSDDDIHVLVDVYGAHALMMLPPRERAFFDWLRRADPPVWNDLWAEDENMLVSLSHLDGLRRGERGFIICELELQPNYFFTYRHIKPPGIEAVDRILRKIERNEDLAVGEVLLFEIARAPIDLWHFCYKYSVSLPKARLAVEQLTAHGWLVHLTQREDLASYLDVE